MKDVKITVELTTYEAQALAQCVKRFHYGTAERLSDPSVRGEADEMISAICAVKRALEKVGYCPR